MQEKHDEEKVVKYRLLVIFVGSIVQQGLIEIPVD